MTNGNNVSGSTNPLLAAALRYLARGWSVIPIGNEKRPWHGIQWKAFQSTPANEQVLHEWFAAPDVTGVAVVLGGVSGGLACRDFDDGTGYTAWAESHPNLARTLPTARTARGYHVYFRCAGFATRKCADGELRGEGGYVILPPSRHPQGIVYSWINPPDAVVPEIDLSASGLPDSDCPLYPTGRQGGRDSREGGEAVRQGHDNQNPVDPASLLGKSPQSDPIPDECFVTGPGQHDQKTLMLARFVKLGVGVRTAAEARPWFDLWYEKGKSSMRESDPDLARMKFNRAFDLARIPLNYSPAVRAMERVQTEPPPPEVQQYRGEKTRKLVALLFQLGQMAGTEVFALSSHQAARLIGTDPGTAHTALHELAADGLIQCADRGRPGPPGSKAARWRWLGNG